MAISNELLLASALLSQRSLPSILLTWKKRDPRHSVTLRWHRYDPQYMLSISTLSAAFNNDILIYSCSGVSMDPTDTTLFREITRKGKIATSSLRLTGYTTCR